MHIHQIFQTAPYNQRNARDTLNATDSIYNTADCVTGSPDGLETGLTLATDSTHAVGTFNVVLGLSSSTTATTCSTGGGPGGHRPGAG